MRLTCPKCGRETCLPGCDQTPTAQPASELPEGVIAVCRKCRQDVFVSANGWLRCGRCNIDFRAEALAQDGWREIESAPRDGSLVLLWFPEILPAWAEGAWKGSWHISKQHWRIATPLNDGGRQVHVNELPLPTHWMPLPPSPQEGK